MVRLLNLLNIMLWGTCCLEWWDVCGLVGGVSLLFGQTHMKICVLQEGGWIFLGCTFFLCWGLVVHSNIDSHSISSGSLFAVLVYYLEVGDVGLGMVFGIAVFVNCTGDDYCVLLLHFQTSAGIVLYKKACNFLLSKAICRLCFVLVVIEFYL